VSLSAPVAYSAERILRDVTLFGKPYTWIVLDGKIRLVPGHQQVRDKTT
jgi:hypothetical protein